jgi:large subunit ribosomal protein L24e
MHRNPRKTSWTAVYRRKNKKGSIEEVSKKRTRRTTKAYRPITGATLESILQKRNQKPEVRKAQREEAIRLIVVPLPVCMCVYIPYVNAMLCRAAKEKASAKKKSKVQQAQKVIRNACVHV